MLGNSIHRSIWKHWEVEERVLGRAWVPVCCFIKCQTGLGTDWISGPKISMGLVQSFFKCGIWWDNDG